MRQSNAVGIQAEYRDDYKIVTYCDFEFSSFPFEFLTCKVTYRLSDLTVGYITLSKPSIYFNFNNDEMTRIKIGTNLPYDIYAEATDPFMLDDLGYLYASTGVTFHLTRNNLGLLISRFYAPMASFAILATLSFNIHIDAVSYLYTNSNSKFLNLPSQNHSFDKGSWQDGNGHYAMSYFIQCLQCH